MMDKYIVYIPLISFIYYSGFFIMLSRVFLHGCRSRKICCSTNLSLKLNIIHMGKAYVY